MRSTLRSAGYPFRLALWGAARLLRRARRPPRFIVFVLEGDMPELPDPPVPFWRRPLARRRLNLFELSKRLAQVAAEHRVEGVVLHLRPAPMPMARIQALRREVQLLRDAGKRVVCWSSQYSTGAYLLACGSDGILLQPGGSIGPLGVRRRYLFLASALERAGVRAEMLSVGPYKTAADVLTRSRMSAEMREMEEWLAHDQHAQLVDAIAAGRGVPRERAEELVDQSPFTDEAALREGAVDGVLAEADLPPRLGSGTPVRRGDWSVARRTLLPAPPELPGGRVAILRVEGLIVDGESSRPPLTPPGGAGLVFQTRTGDLTLARQARRLAADRRVAAVVLHVDSGGGSATASEAMSAALAALASRKPLVAAMGSVAASGGYYVTCPARHVTAWPSTLTGSIGVLGGKLVVGGLLQRLLVHEESVQRGRHVGMFDPVRPFTEEERRHTQEAIDRSYRLFVDRVATGRSMAPEQVDASGRGRVYTGAQAHERRLVDGLGGLPEAVATARRLANLDARSAVFIVSGGSGPAAPSSPASAITYPFETLEALSAPSTLCLSPLLDGGRV